MQPVTKDKIQEKKTNHEQKSNNPKPSASKKI